MSVKKCKCSLLLTVLFVSFAAQAQQLGGLSEEIVIEEPEKDGDFSIVSPSGEAATIQFDESDHTGVVRAIGDLQSDIEKVTGMKPTFSSSTSATDKKIIVGTIGRSSLIDNLVSSGELDIDGIKNNWESFAIRATKDTLIIAGSDMRGTIYGVYELSRQLGVSPWYWWADVPPRIRASAYVKSGSYISEEPKVKYRGIFIND